MYLPAIETYVPNDILWCLWALLEFCYIAHYDVITKQSLAQLKDALKRFHHYCEAFNEIDVCPGSSFPWQHSLTHYADSIRLFGAPNELCTSITEAKHIKAVKKPWRRTNHHKPLKQMLYITQCLDKLAAMRTDFTNWGMLESAGLWATLEMTGVFFTCPLPYRSHSRNTPEVSHIEVESPNGKANAQTNTTSYDDYDGDDDEDEANTDEVACKLAPFCVLLGRRTCESIYLTIRLHNLILMFT